MEFAAGFFGEEDGAGGGFDFGDDGAGGEVVLDGGAVAGAGFGGEAGGDFFGLGVYGDGEVELFGDLHAAKEREVVQRERSHRCRNWT